MPTKTPRERIQEIMFATCPVDVQEPFFWKWNEHGLDMLEAFYVALLEEARKEEREKLATFIRENRNTVTLVQIEDFISSL